LERGSCGPQGAVFTWCRGHACCLQPCCPRASDALRDAYHLREWLWHDLLEHDPALQVAIMGASGTEAAWNAWVNHSFLDFPIIRELCNGSKHFEDGATIKVIHRPGWDSPVSFWDNPESGWDDNGFYVETDSGRIVAVIGLVTGARDFWSGLFAQFPQLG
jgi:hypothetical protein